MRNSLIFARYFEMNCRLFSILNSNFLFQDANLKEAQKDTKEGSGKINSTLGFVQKVWHLKMFNS